MRRYLSLSFSLLVMLAAATALLLRTPDASPQQSRRASMPPQSEEAEENPAEREKQEWMQFRDPATGEIPRGIRQAEMAFAAKLPKRDAILAKSATGGYDWRLAGPYNIGGRTRALAIDEASPNTFLAGGVTGGIWRSTNRGASWRTSTTPDQLPSVTCIAQDGRASKRNIWYYGTGEFRTNSGRFGNTVWPGNGIFKSIDSGKSWTQLGSTTSSTPEVLDNPFEYVNNIVTDRSAAEIDEVYAACYGTIMRSADGGETWSAVLGGAWNNVGFTTVAITQTGVLYAGFGSGGTVSGLWRSVDGITWHDITPTGWTDSCRRIVLCVPPSNPNALYVLAETPGNGLIVPGSYGFTEYYSLWHYDYLSGTGGGVGGSWSDRSNYLPQLGGPQTYNGLNSYTMHLAAAPNDENSIYLGGTNLYHSSTGFTTINDTRWLGGYTEYGGYSYEGGLHPDQHVLLFSPGALNRLIVGTDGGIFLTDDPTATAPQWGSLNNDYYTTQFYTVAIDQQSPGSNAVMGGMQDNGTVFSTDPNPLEQMMNPFNGDGSFCAMRDRGYTLVVSAQNSVMYRVHVINGAPTEYVRLDPEGGSGYLFVNPFALDPSYDRILYNAGGSALWRNSDIEEVPFDSTYKRATVNWTRLQQTAKSHTISAIGVSTESPRHRVYFGTTAGRVYRLDDAHTGDPKPVDITGASFPRGAYVNCIAVDPVDGNRALVVFTNYNVQSLFYTSDGGATWSAVGGNLEEHADGTGNGPSCRWATIARHGDDGVIFVGTTTGLYSTEMLDGAATVWSQEGSATFGNVRVDMIAARSSDGFVAVGTWGKGLYTARIPTLGVESVDGLDPKGRPDLR